MNHAYKTRQAFKDPKVRAIEKRISDRLAVHHRPKDKAFWHGYLVAAVEMATISQEDYIQLRDMITGRI